MPLIRGLDNELHTVFMYWGRDDEPVLVDDREDPEAEGTQLYVPTESEQALADLIAFGSYDETGGVVGEEEQLAVVEA